MRIAVRLLAAALCFTPSRVIVAGPQSPTGAAPAVRVLPLPSYPGAHAIWGSTGVDASGHVWFGVTSGDERPASAHLFEFDPTSQVFADRGNVVAELQRLKLHRPGETQMKIHSRVVQASDGLLYFASMDETGENPDGSKLPTWGGHLWRIRAGRWQHLAATPEALIAVAAGGQFVYSLGYFNHVLYQFDTRTSRIRSIAVGSAGGHVSRNFFADDRGHVFVPRVNENARGLSASLVEFDERLSEIASTPLREYFERDRDDSHGIVAIHPGADHSWLFATGKGRLYRVNPGAGGGAAEVTDLGWFHPAGSRYVASMFRDERTGILHGVAAPNNYHAKQFEWVSRPLESSSRPAVFPFGSATQLPIPALLYGSMARDAAGHFYVVGTMGDKPLVLQVTVVEK